MPVVTKENGDKTFSLLLHADAGMGKSTLGATTPAPRLIMDAEGRAKYLPTGPKVYWNPRTQAPPEPNGWDTCIVDVMDYQTTLDVYQHLRAGTVPVVSVVMDSLMETQKRAIDIVSGLNQPTQPEWGVLLRKLDSLVRSYCDLRTLPDNPIRCVVFTVGSAESDGKMRPLLQGALRKTLPYQVDAVGYLGVEYSLTEMDEYGRPKEERLLDFQPRPGIVAKDGTGQLPPRVLCTKGAPVVSWLIDQLKTEGELA